MAQTSAAEQQARQRLATNVRRLRTERGVSAQDAAEKIGMHWRHWQKIETAEVGATLGTLTRLATALGVDVVDLLSRPPTR